MLEGDVDDASGGIENAPAVDAESGYGRGGGSIDVDGIRVRELRHDTVAHPINKIGGRTQLIFIMTSLRDDETGMGFAAGITNASGRQEQRDLFGTPVANLSYEGLQFFEWKLRKERPSVAKLLYTRSASAKSASPTSSANGR